MGCQGDLARRRRQGLRDALRRAGQFALEAGCDAVTIGGDLYEHDRAGVDTARFLAETFAGWRPTRVFIAPGNHDALLPGSIHRRTKWPDNVSLFTDPDFVPIPLRDGLTLWGLAHCEPEWRGRPLAGFIAPGEGVHLALFHGAEMGSRPEGKSAHGPFEAEQIAEAGLAAALCGHYHHRRIDARSHLVYPGSPEPLTFDEDGERGPVIVEVLDDGQIRYDALNLNRWRVASITCDLESCTSQQDVLEALVAACLPAAQAGDPERTLLRVDLSGSVSSSVPLDAFTIESEARDRLDCALVKVRDRTSPAHDVEAAQTDRGTRGAFARAAVAAEREATPAEAGVLHDALRYGLAALSGSEVGLR